MQQYQESQQSKPSFLRAHWRSFLSGGIVLAAVVLFAIPKQSQRHDDMSTPVFKKQGTLTFLHQNKKPIAAIDIEIADDDNKREVGLMDRPTMEENQGMLFIFDRAEYASFWMHNTILPLDMLFIDASGEIKTIHKNTTPFSDQTYQATAPVIYVLEVIGGYCDKHQVAVGDRIEWHRQ